MDFSLVLVFVFYYIPQSLYFDCYFSFGNCDPFDHKAAFRFTLKESDKKAEF